jgi:hypothetical protein
MMGELELFLQDQLPSLEGVSRRAFSKKSHKLLDKFLLYLILVLGNDHSQMCYSHNNSLLTTVSTLICATYMANLESRNFRMEECPGNFHNFLHLVDSSQ